jgi:putative colanic acid biosynthesis glycosyltransferase
MLPKISVITINRNMADDLANTIESVLAQAYPNLEYLIIDGQSSDGSVEVIRANAGRIAYWSSERDRSLYDAMNKGVRAATGDWIIFMNSGDRFSDDNVLDDMFAVDHAGHDLVYGHAVWHHPRVGVDTERRAEPPEVLPLRMNCSHQALFTRRELLLEHPFEVDLLVADYAFLVRAWRSGARFYPMDRVVCRASAGGVSDRKRLQSLWQRLHVLFRQRLATPALLMRYAVMMVWEPLAGLVKGALPASAVKVLLRSRHRD